MESKIKVQHFVCPDVHVPENLERKRKASHESKRPVDALESKYISKKEETLGDMLKSVRDLGSSGLTGQARLKYKNDKLTKLGAPPPKEQTMPFKMKMGILAGRKKREAKQLAESKVSNLVYPKAHFTTMKPKAKERKTEAFDFEPRTYGGVLKLNKDRLPKGLGGTKAAGGSGGRRGKVRRGT